MVTIRVILVTIVLCWIDAFIHVRSSFGCVHFMKCMISFYIENTYLYKKGKVTLFIVMRYFHFFKKFFITIKFDYLYKYDRLTNVSAENRFSYAMIYRWIQIQHIHFNDILENYCTAERYRRVYLFFI